MKFIGGFIAGSFFGMIMYACAVVAGESDRMIEHQNKKY